MTQTVEGMKAKQAELCRKINHLEEVNEEMLNQQVILREVCCELDLDADAVTGAEVLKALRALKQDNRDLRFEVTTWRGGR